MVKFPEGGGIAMGNGYIYKCSKCGHEEQYLIGVGFTAPTEREEVQAMLWAEVTKEWGNLFNVI